MDPKIYFLLRRIGWISCFVAGGLFLFSGLMLWYRTDYFAWQFFAGGILFPLVPIFMQSAERKFIDKVEEQRDPGRSEDRDS